MNYELYHDESKVDGYWHGMLLVPTAGKSLFLHYLKDIRKNTNYQYPLAIKNIHQKGKPFFCAEAWVWFAVAAMITKSKGNKFQISLGERERGQPVYRLFEDYVGATIGAKFILFREIDALQKMSNHIDYGAKVEITGGMGLKGGLHFLGSEDNPIKIVKMHFDGFEHYQRNIDKDRIVGRLKGLREYCEIEDNEDLIDDKTGNHKRNDSQRYEDCQFLQLTDLLVGSFRTVLGSGTRSIHQKIGEPVKYLVDKYKEGYARMQNSRWRNSFCMSECYLENDSWVFKTIVTAKEAANKQLTFFEK